MIAGYAGGKVLWSLDAAGRGFYGIAGNGNRGARTPGVGIEKILTDEYLSAGSGESRSNVVTSAVTVTESLRVMRGAGSAAASGDGESSANADQQKSRQVRAPRAFREFFIG